MKLKRLRIGILPSLVIILAASLLVTAIVLTRTAEPRVFGEFLELVDLKPSLLVLNYLPALMLMLALYFIFNNAVLSVAISSTVFIGMAYANKMKILMRQDPVTPTDLKLAGEAVTIFKNFGDSYTSAAAAGIVIAVIALAAAVVFLAGKRMNIFFRLGVLGLLIITGGLLYFGCYADDELYDSYFVIGNQYSKVNQYASKGFVYSFIHDMSSLKVEKPDGYLRYPYDQMTEDYDRELIYPEDFKPNVIMIMGEAFSDLSENENLDFEGYTDPLKNFKELADEEGSVSGHIVAPNFGGGTADTEFDVLSGCSTRYIYNGLTSYNFIRKSFRAIPSVFSDAGYDTMAIHPGYSWFYNRENVYDYFGFDEFYHLEKDFDEETQNKGLYISDEAATDFIIESFEEQKEKSGSPIFSFTVTIQNHGPFLDKYGVAVPNFNTEKSLDEEQANMLTNYFQGNIDADEELRRLAEHFRDYDEPVIIVYFGDHLPGFTNGMELLEALDYSFDVNGAAKERIAMYETPYLIWSNENARKELNLANEARELSVPEKGGIISSNYLGTMLMELIGFEGVSPMWDFSNSLIKKLPVITRQAFMRADGEFVELEELDEDELNDVRLMQGWTYYKVFDAD